VALASCNLTCLASEKRETHLATEAFEELVEDFEFLDDVESDASSRD